MQWVAMFFVAYIWFKATGDWGWNGWAAFFFACFCAGALQAIWQVIFGRGLFDEQPKSAESNAGNEEGGGLVDTAFKMGAGYGIGKLTGKKTYAYQCRSCNHYEERSQEKIGAKCPRCGTGWMKVSKV